MWTFKRFYFFLLAAVLLGGAACSSDESGGDDNPDPGTGTGPISEINGTAIDPGNNLVGLISDASTGEGIPGVPVTDGYSFTQTDANGVYQFEANRYCRNVYYITPANYKIAVDEKTKLPLFYSTSAIDRYQTNRNDFVLEPLSAIEENFTFIAIGDPQCESDSDVNRFRTETIQDISSTIASEQASGRYLNAYAVTLGDITFDNTVQWDPMVESMSNVKVGAGYLPIFNCIGNHDHDAGTSTDYLATNNYVTRLGPTDYAFNRGKAHIVVMDDVVCTTTSGSTWSYNAGFSEAQYNWLKADLDLVENKADKLVFLCCHIPFRAGSSSGGSNVNKDKFYDEVLDLLTQFKEAHIMIGHTHYPQNYIHTQKVCQGGKPIYEHVHGGACGAWWCSNLNTDGAPNGYSIYEVRGSSVYNWVAKSTNQPASYQMRVYDGNAVYSGQKGYSYTWTGGGKGGSNNINVNGLKTLEGCFVVSLWNDDPSNWKVELIQNGVSTPMKRISSGISDMCVVSFFFNELNKNTTTWTRSLSHYWYAKSVSGKPSEDKNWTVRATQTIPSSGVTNVYESSALQTDFSGFAWN